MPIPNCSGAIRQVSDIDAVLTGPHRMPTVNLANMRESGARALAAALLASEMAAGSGSRYRKLVSFGLMPNLPPPIRLKSADSFREKYRALCGFWVAFISPRHAWQAKSLTQKALAVHHRL
jgi:hypothetical protein